MSKFQKVWLKETLLYMLGAVCILGAVMGIGWLISICPQIILPILGIGVLVWWVTLLAWISAKDKERRGKL